LSRIVCCLVHIYYMSFFERQDLKWFSVWWVLGYGWISLVWYLSLMSIPPEMYPDYAFNDKIGHFLAYAWLMFWFGNLYRSLPARLIFAGLFILMGISLEILQGMGQVRQFEYYDMLANTIGVLIGMVMILMPLANVLVWVEGFLKISYDKK